MASTSLNSSSSSSASTSSARRRWTREQLLKSLEILGPLSAPLPPQLPPSPPASCRSSPAPHSAKRKLDTAPESTSIKRVRLASPPERSQRHHHQHNNAQQPSPSARRPANAAQSLNSRLEPSEDGEVREDVDSFPLNAQVSLEPNAVPVRRPRRGRPTVRTFDELHDKYHQYGRKLKYSGDARLWSAYPPTHKEYRPLANPPPPGSSYYQNSGLIARLELLDALLCFTYAMWMKDFIRQSCFHETWSTIDAFLGWCMAKWETADVHGEQEKALLGLIFMIQAFIHSRKLVYANRRSVDPEMRRLWDQLKADMVDLGQAAVRDESKVNSGQHGLGLQSTPPMLPSPASLPPNSANSTPINNSTGGTPNTFSNNISTSATAATANSTPPIQYDALSQLIVDEIKKPLGFEPKQHIPPVMVNAAAKASTPIGPSFAFSLVQQSEGIRQASNCMIHSQKYLTLSVLAEHYPTTLARMLKSSLSAHEEYEPDLEDEEGELFWPGQCITGEGLGWVCLMGKAMVQEIGRGIGYKGVEGVVPKPNPPVGEAGSAQR
ncbi:hypothetical protein CONPUDRAFT_136120 [Coniophora puteana RWD-64-598 SS2]|uniref:Uncharacterized protein n=1 Tax=Coniophora puteana (strain RWD-64-598) TaxID=741705 RepID=A0A5M3MVZ6_CONPW|nr:uncharacterized protein CONPUDRAFT_136120 [Coniophora puteana RWD-64-598 SS2]EIW82904.1 hypothetical protein CONPUDRAFT_136120 [Coniophora puteana RWD-64-598 SS2]